MTIQTIIRLGAVAMIISGAALGYSYVSHPHHMTPQVIASSSWFIIHLLFALSLALGLLGTTALYASTAIRSSWMGLVGYVTLFIGMLLIFGLDYYEVLIAPFLAVQYPQVIHDHGAGDAMGMVAVAFPAAGILTVIGYAMLAFAWMKAGVLHRGVAAALIFTSVAFGVGLSPIGGLATARITATAFGLALMAIGIAAWRSTRNGQAAVWA